MSPKQSVAGEQDRRPRQGWDVKQAGVSPSIDIILYGFEPVNFLAAMLIGQDYLHYFTVLCYLGCTCFLTHQRHILTFKVCSITTNIRDNLWPQSISVQSEKFGFVWFLFRDRQTFSSKIITSRPSNNSQIEKAYQCCQPGLTFLPNNILNLYQSNWFSLSFGQVSASKFYFINKPFKCQRNILKNL